MRSIALLLVMLWASLGSAQREPWSLRMDGFRLASQLHAADLSRREEAARALAERGDPRRARDALIEALGTERSGRVRAAIARSLCAHGHPAAVPALIQAFDVARERDGRAIARALAEIGQRDGIRALVDAMGRADLVAAARFGLEIAGPRAAPFLIGALRAEPVNPAIVELVGQIGDAHAVASLIDLVESDVPPVRQVAVQALGEIADGRARSAVLRAVGDPAVEVRTVALWALGRVGTAADASVLVGALNDAEVAQQRPLLEALLALDPAAGAESIVASVTSDDPLRVRVAGDVALRNPSPALLPVLYGLLQEGSRADEAASALAEVEAGAGIPVLLREVQRPAARRALAVAARRWSDRLSSSLKQDIWDALARGEAADPSAAMRVRFLRALALDDSVRQELIRGLQHQDASERGWSAYGLSLLGADGTAELFEAGLEVEPDAEAWRRLAWARVELSDPVDHDLLPHLWSRLDSPRTAPEALQVLVRVEDLSAAERRRVGVALRTGLRSREARTRAGAARALAAWGDKRAWRALLNRLDVDERREVRHAAAQALLTLAPDESRDALAGRARIEDDSQLRELLREAARGAPARLAYPTGRRVLRFRVAAASRRGGVPVDLILPDGRWWRIRTLPTGELFVPSLIAGQADVQVRIDPR